MGTRVTTMSEVSDAQNFMKEYVFGFMFHDIEAAISGKANFLAALGLMEYTEIMGGFVNGELQDKTKTGENFNKFLPYLGTWYVELDKQLKKTGKEELYGRVRCGLAHQYFIKGHKTIYMSYPENSDAHGIEYIESENRIEFVVTRYFADFKTAVEVYHRRLVFKKDMDLLDALAKARKNLA